MIQLNNIFVEFGGFEVLKDISLHVKEGEFFTFLGPSECGKTTILKTIAGFIEPSRGSVLMKGKDITHVPIEKRKVGIVFHSYALFPTMTVYDNIAFGLKIKKFTKSEINSKVREVALKVDLSSEQLEKAVSQLSLEQQQKAAIARALVIEPSVICVDEPLSNLETKLRVRLRSELKKIQREFGMTIVYVTQSQEEALTLSDRIAVINKGMIEQTDTPNEIYNNSKTEFVANFIGDINKLSPELLTAAGLNLPENQNHFIRLERVHMENKNKSGGLEGIIENQEYYGLYIKYYIRVKNQILKVIEINDGVRIYNHGESVSVTINPADIMSYKSE